MTVYESCMHIWIKSRLAEIGQSQNDLAAHLGIAQPRVSEIIKGTRRVSTTELPKLAAFLEMGVADVLARLEDPGTPDTIDVQTARGDDNFSSEFIPARRSLPVRGMAQGGMNGSFELNGDPVDYIYRPAALDGVPEAYAVYMVGVSMEPRYHEGETLYVHPSRPARPGDYVVLQVASPNGEPARAFVKRFVRRDNGEFVFEQYNPVATVRHPAENMVSMHRIIMAGDH